MGSRTVQRVSPVGTSYLAEPWVWRCRDCGWTGNALTAPDAWRDAIMHTCNYTSGITTMEDRRWEMTREALSQFMKTPALTVTRTQVRKGRSNSQW